MKDLALKKKKKKKQSKGKERKERHGMANRDERSEATLSRGRKSKKGEKEKRGSKERTRKE